LLQIRDFGRRQKKGKRAENNNNEGKDIGVTRTCTT